MVTTTDLEQYNLPSAIPAIELIDVHTAFDGGEWVLKGVNFAAQAGRITCLLGPSGVGKTTCLRHVTGLLPPNQGDVLVDGESTLSMRKAKRQALGKRFGVLLQGSGLYGSALWESMTVEENMIQQLHLARDWNEHESLERAREWLKAVGLASNANMVPSQLSAGMRRRVGLARALVGEPEYAVIDSFELGVDSVRLRQLCELVATSHERSGGTYLIATQNMGVARRLAHDVVILYEGRVIEQGPAMDVFDSPRPEVHQFVNGLTEGPLGVAGDRGAHPPLERLDPPTRPGEDSNEMPLPLVAFGMLVTITASALVLGARAIWELSIIAAAWVITLTLLAVRSKPGDK